MTVSLFSPTSHDSIPRLMTVSLASPLSHDSIPCVITLSLVSQMSHVSILRLTNVWSVSPQFWSENQSASFSGLGYCHKITEWKSAGEKDGETKWNTTVYGKWYTGYGRMDGRFTLALLSPAGPCESWMSWKVHKDMTWLFKQSKKSIFSSLVRGVCSPCLR